MPYPSEEDFYASGNPDVGDARPHSDIDGTGRALPSLLGEMGDQLDDLTDNLGNTITQAVNVAAQAAVDVHVTDATSAHAASAVSFAPTGTVAATTVQGAIVEVNNEKSSTTHSHALDDLTDVATPAPADGQVLKWSASAARWSPSTDLVGGGGGGAVTMGDLTDVDLTGLTSGNGITYNGTDFVPTDLATQAELNTDATNLANHLADTSDAHDASAISFVPAGTVAATTVQAAIEEVAAEGGGGGGVTLEEVQDNLGTSFLQAGNNITLTYSDPFNLVSIAVDPLTHSDITDWDAQVKEVVAGTGVTVSSTSTETEIVALQPIITDYTAGSHTWTRGADVKMVEVICIGAGGGGGSGSRGSGTGVVRGGGAGGASGNYARVLFSATEVGPSNEAVTVGSGGAGGPAVTTNGVNGNAGSAGGITSFGAHIAASGGGGGGGGVQGASGAGGTSGQLGTRGTNAGFTGATGAGAAAAVTVSNFLLNASSNGYVSGSGGGGGSIDASNAVQGSSNGGAGPFHRTSATLGGTGGGAGVAGGAGAAAGTYGGSGGGGGGAGTAGVSGAGGVGGRGAGGGGSGGAAAGFTASAGGAGGAGFCRVIEYR